MIPVVGEFADGISAMISFARGDIAGGLLDLSSMIPLLGNATGALKIGTKVAGAVGIMKAADKIADVVAPVTKILNKAEDLLSPVAKIVDNVTGPLKKFGDDALAAVGSLFAKEGAQKLGKEISEEIVEEVTEEIAENTGKIVDDLVTTNKPYTNSRPSYGSNQVEEVWENAKQIDGKVYDPNTGEELFWDTTKSRNGQWDMGHTSENKYSEWHNKYLNDEISKDEFIDWYRNPENYMPESSSANRSHKYE